MPIVMTIDVESRQNKSLVLDLDNWRERYVTNNGLLTFPSPTIFTIEKNLYFLLRNSTQKKLDPKFKYRPSYLSKYEYGTPVLDKLLMYVNNCFCLEDFDFDIVTVPSLQAITTICQDKVTEKKPSDMKKVEW